MKVTLLGIRSPVPTQNWANSGYLVEFGDEMPVFDHGAGAHVNFSRACKRAIDLNTIFFTHLNTDQCLDYARLVHSLSDKVPDRFLIFRSMLPHKYSG